jgi:hypothetical protein
MDSDDPISVEEAAYEEASEDEYEGRQNDEASAHDGFNDASLALTGHYDDNNLSPQPLFIEPPSPSPASVDLAQEQLDGNFEQEGDASSICPSLNISDMEIREERFAGAAKIIGHTESYFASLRHQQLRNGHLYHPFTSFAEWEAAQWLHKNHLARDAVDDFYKLEIVSYSSEFFVAKNTKYV